MVRTDAQTAKTPEERAAALALLNSAREKSNVRAYPYDLKTQFTSFGSSPSDGVWNLEDISPDRQTYRWTADGPGFSALYLRANGLQWGSDPLGNIPLRLAQAREAIFFQYSLVGRYASLRLASGFLDGGQVRCILVRKGAGNRMLSGGRNWDETEYCANDAGLLVTYSPVPGLYFHYDYSSALHFRDKVIPGAFAIEQAGQLAVQAKTLSVTDAPGADNAMFRTTGLEQLGVGIVVGPAEIIEDFVHAERLSSMSNPTTQIVIVHGLADLDGHRQEPEVLESTNPALEQDALNLWSKLQPPLSEAAQPGVTAPWRELIVVYHFIVGAS
jgi:hypothetical protein